MTQEMIPDVVSEIDNRFDIKQIASDYLDTLEPVERIDTLVGLQSFLRIVGAETPIRVAAAMAVYLRCCPGFERFAERQGVTL